MIAGGESSTHQLDDGAREVVLAEYKALRDEILKKMDHRATFRVSALTLGLAAIGIGIERKSGVLLLLAPVAVVLLNNMASFHSMQIARTANYVRDVIEPKLTRQYPDSIGWHKFVGDRATRFRETLLSFHLSNLIFVFAPSLVSIALGWAYLGSLILTIALTLLDVSLLGLFCWNYFHLRLVL
jgi:hypothetical protein